LCVLGLSGCEWLKGRSSKDNLDPPAELVDFETTAPVDRAWSRNLGDGIERSGTKPRPVEADGIVYASDLDGSVFAVDLLTGKPRWSVEADKRLSSGPGVGGGLVVVGGLDGDVIALDRDSGSAKWTTKVSSEVLASPVIAGGDGRFARLVVRSRRAADQPARQCHAGRARRRGLCRIRRRQADRTGTRHRRAEVGTDHRHAERSHRTRANGRYRR